MQLHNDTENGFVESHVKSHASRSLYAIYGCQNGCIVQFRLDQVASSGRAVQFGRGNVASIVWGVVRRHAPFYSRRRWQCHHHNSRWSIQIKVPSSSSLRKKERANRSWPSFCAFPSACVILSTARTRKRQSNTLFSSATTPALWAASPSAAAIRVRVTGTIFLSSQSIMEFRSGQYTGECTVRRSRNKLYIGLMENKCFNIVVIQVYLKCSVS